MGRAGLFVPRFRRKRLLEIWVDFTGIDVLIHSYRITRGRFKKRSCYVRRCGFAFPVASVTSVAICHLRTSVARLAELLDCGMKHIFRGYIVDL
jgi:hypothetical protein